MKHEQWTSYWTLNMSCVNHLQGNENVQLPLENGERNGSQFISCQWWYIIYYCILLNKYPNFHFWCERKFVHSIKRNFLGAGTRVYSLEYRWFINNLGNLFIFFVQMNRKWCRLLQSIYFECLLHVNGFILFWDAKKRDICLKIYANNTVQFLNGSMLIIYTYFHLQFGENST